MQSQLSPFHSQLEKLIAENPECKRTLTSSNQIMSKSDELLILLANSIERYVWGFIGKTQVNYYSMLVIHCPRNEKEVVMSLQMFKKVWSYEYFKPEEFYYENEFKLCKSIPEAIEALSNMIVFYRQTTQYPLIF